MSARPQRGRRPRRCRIGRVSYYLHHGAWWVYYRDDDRPIRRRVAETADEAERIAAQINAQLASASPTLLSFQPVAVGDLRDRFLAHHDDVLRSSINTVRRYRAATQHLLDFVAQSVRPPRAHEVSPSRFASFLRERDVTPNGHPHTARRKLRDKGVRFILEVCRSLYAYAQRMRHLPPFASNPFSDLGLDRMQTLDAKPVFVFSAESEISFLRAASDWEFGIHFVMAKTGLRPGELIHLLIEDVDLASGWLHVRNKMELGWRIKTGAERMVPLAPEVCRVLERGISGRTAGPVFVRPRFDPAGSLAANLDRKGMARLLDEQLVLAETAKGAGLPRIDRLRIARSLWRDAGALKSEAIRCSFIRIAQAAQLDGATCPKSWRHSFATLMQDANVDPLIRQITLGHKPQGTQGALGMTSVYTHTRASTQREAILRALQLWPESLALASSRCGPP